MQNRISVQFAAKKKSKKALSPKGREKAAAEGGVVMSKAFTTEVFKIYT